MLKLKLPSYKELSSLCKEDTSFSTPFYLYDEEAHPWIVATDRVVAICFRLPIAAVPLPEAKVGLAQKEIEGWFDEDLSNNSATIIELARVREWASKDSLLIESPCPDCAGPSPAKTCQGCEGTGKRKTVPLGKALNVVINRALLAQALSYIRFTQEPSLTSPEPNILVSSQARLPAVRSLTFRAIDNTWLIKICERIPDGTENIKELCIR